MLRVTLRGVLERKLRLLLTAISIALGVAFVAGSYILTDTLSYAFTSLFSKTGAKVDVVLQSPSRFVTQQNSFMRSDRAPVPAWLLDQVRKAPGVQVASGEVFGFAQIVGKDGKAISTTGAPTLGVSVQAEPLLNTATIREGRQPRGPEEVAIDAHTARAHGFQVGDTVTILTEGPPLTFTLAGTFGFEDVDSMAGATVAAFDLTTAQSVLGKAYRFDDIAVKGLPGWSQQQVRDSVARTVGGQWEVITGQTQSDRTLDAVKQGLGFVSTAMFIFAAIALFVGAFIIFNTFSILVAQRTREFGLLRALGAGVGQVIGSIVVEALCVGVLASVVGLALGGGIAVLLTTAINALGIELPPAPLQYQPRTFIASIAVGVGVTLLAAVGPALRTRRLSPMDALRTGLVDSRQRRALRRLMVGMPAAVVGLGLLFAGMTGRTGHGVVFFIAGAVAVFLGVGVLGAFVMRPLAVVVGWPLVRIFRLTARLGLRNAMRSPTRTARTAAALTIGVGLISFVTIFGASMKASTGAMIDNALAADYVMTPTSQGGGFSPDVAQQIRQVMGVEAVGDLRVGYFERNGQLIGVGGTDWASFSDVTNVTVLSGNMARFDQSGGVAIGKKIADQDQLRVGDTISMTFDRTGTQRIKVVAVYDDSQGSMGEYLLGMKTFTSNYSTQLDSLAAIKLSSTAGQATRDAISKAAAAYPNVKLQDMATFKQDVLAQIDQLLGLVYTLLALAVVIAVLGIVNTLALSTLERVRELGLLRAVGMTRREVRAMVRHESVIVAVIGAVLGLAVGVVFAGVALYSLRDSGLGVVAYPVGQLAFFLALAAGAGVLAAVLPARRAARVDILQAVATT
jgi:putative ABC transport system permease protein